MPRIRCIKPEFWQDEKLASLTRDCRLLFIGLWNIADDAGRLRGSPLFIRASVFPYDLDVDVEALLALLETGGFIVRYRHGPESFLWIPNFTKHQRIDRPKESRLPAPPPRALVDASSIDRRSVVDASPQIVAGSGIREQGKEQGSGNGAATVSPAPAPTPAGGAFFAKAQEKRVAAGYPQERLPRLDALSRWFSDALMKLNGDEDLLQATYDRFTEDSYWSKATPPWPFGAFMKRWEDHVPPAIDDAPAVRRRL